MADIGDRLKTALADRYAIQRELGEGGMATVYLARDLKHNREVAVKVLKPELAAALGHERFLREIEISARLRHPHILPLYDSGESDGFLFYVMPYVEGESLAERLRREKQLPLEDAVRIAREVADALSYAHGRDVVHRDIKPDNILLESGHAVVADFGIARAITAAGGEQITETGMAVGTPRYMSPEQVAGQQDLDGRSDLYSLACVLYEMLAGQPPFTGPTLESIIAQHLSAEPPSITAIRPAVPAALAGVLQRALAKTPADRFNPVAQFSDALAVPATPAAVAPPRSRWLMPAIAAIAVLVAAVAAVVLLRGDASVLVVGATTQVTLDPGLEVDPAISPDGEFVAYAAGPASRMQIYVRRVSGGRPIALTQDSTKNHRWPRWSPDGSLVGYVTGGAIHVVSALGGASRVLVRVAAPRLFARAGSDTVPGFGWSPDGRRIAFTAGWPGEIYVQELDGGGPRAITSGQETHSLAWSPDGSRIAYVDGNAIFVFGTVNFANEGISTIWVAPVDGGEPVRVTPDGALNVSPQWTPDGRHLLWISNQEGTRDVYRVRLSDSGEPQGSPVRLTTGLNAHGLSLSGEGTRLAYATLVSYSNIWSIRVPRSGSISIREARPVTTGSQTIEGMDLSADGRWLAFDSNRGGNADIYKMPVDGGEPVRLTTDPAGDFMPVWSPDDRTILFHSMRNGNRDLFTVSADGGGVTQRTSGPDHELDGDWSADGQEIVYQWWASDGTLLRVIPAVEGGGPERDLEPGAFPEWSPSNREIAYLWDGLLVIPAAGGESQILVPGSVAYSGPQYCAWDPDGRTLYYLEPGESGWGIWSVPATGGTPRMLVDFDDPTRQHARYGFATDGERFYFTLGSHESDVWVMDLERR
jgi:serine/threonine-protein kinase